MQVQWVFEDGIPGSSKASVQRCLERKQSCLDRLLAHYGEDMKHLRISVRRQARGREFELRGVLTLPAATLVAEASGKTFGRKSTNCSIPWSARSNATRRGCGATSRSAANIADGKI